MRLAWGIFPAALLLAACSSDDGGGGGQADTGGEQDAGGEDAATNTTQEYFCDPAGQAVCENDTDCPLVENGTAKAEALTCGKDCLGTPPEDECTSKCIIEHLHTTPECTECLDAFFTCILGRCLLECAGGASEACTECSRNKPTPDESCSAAFFACSGAVLNPDFVPIYE